MFLGLLEVVSGKNLEEIEAVCRKKHGMCAIRSTQCITLVEIRKTRINIEMQKINSAIKIYNLVRKGGCTRLILQT